MPITPFLTANSLLGLAPEIVSGSGTRGTVNTSATAQWIPVQTPQVTPLQKFLRDEALRGSPTAVYDQVAGVRNDTVEFKNYLYSDTFGALVKAVLGGTDTPTTAGSNYIHALKLLNSASTGSQPSSYSILDFDGANYFLIQGAQADSLMLSFGVETLAEVTTKWMGNPYVASTTYSTAPFASPSFATSEHAIPSWDAVAVIGGTSAANVVSGEFNLNRKTQPVFTLGSQAPSVNFAGPLEVTGKMTMVLASNSDLFSTGSSAYALTRDPVSLAVTLTDPNSPSAAWNTVITCTQAQFQNVKRTRGKEFVELEVEFTANANTTDGGGAGLYSPIQFSITNGVSAGY